MYLIHAFVSITSTKVSHCFFLRLTGKMNSCPLFEINKSCYTISAKESVIKDEAEHPRCGCDNDLRGRQRSSGKD